MSENLVLSPPADQDQYTLSPVDVGLGDIPEITHQPSQTAEIIGHIQAMEQLPPEQRKQALADLRAARDVNVHGRSATEQAAAIDDAIIDLAQAGNWNVVEELTTLSVY